MAQLEQQDPIYRTSPERTYKMMAIMLGICIVGGGIFFGMWDYWISMPPTAGNLGAQTDDHGGDVVATGVEIPVSLSFVESSDFRTLAFNALPGEPGNNPEIRVKSGDEVIIPPYTFIATASAVLMANAVPIFVDIDPKTCNIDPDKIEEAITDKTKVIMPVHITGNPAQMSKILDISKKYGISVIEDAAQAHGAEWEDTKVGALGLGGIFSFQTSKNMSAGEGGAIISNDQEFLDKSFSYHNCGRTTKGAFYDHQLLGGNFRF